MTAVRWRHGGWQDTTGAQPDCVGYVPRQERDLRQCESLQVSSGGWHPNFTFRNFTLELMEGGFERSKAGGREPIYRQQISRESLREMGEGKPARPGGRDAAESREVDKCPFPGYSGGRHPASCERVGGRPAPWTPRRAGPERGLKHECKTEGKVLGSGGGAEHRPGADALGRSSAIGEHVSGGGHLDGPLERGKGR